jgi:hypothetical protein
MLKSIYENWPILSGPVAPLLMIDLNSIKETIIVAALGTLASLIVKSIYDKYIKKLLK